MYNIQYLIYALKILPGLQYLKLNFRSSLLNTYRIFGERICFKIKTI